tara:strand:+ start:411 stop:512 length:102 start_codon:yes stop_codon:yes gene_type:complete
MKKIFLILIFVLLWCNVGIAGEKEVKEIIKEAL